MGSIRAYVGICGISVGRISVYGDTYVALVKVV